jgi:hypothetical protein
MSDLEKQLDAISKQLKVEEKSFYTRLELVDSTATAPGFQADQRALLEVLERNPVTIVTCAALIVLIMMIETMWFFRKMGRRSVYDVIAGEIAKTAIAVAQRQGELQRNLAKEAGKAAEREDTAAAPPPNDNLSSAMRDHAQEAIRSHLDQIGMVMATAHEEVDETGRDAPQPVAPSAAEKRVGESHEAGQLTPVRLEHGDDKDFFVFCLPETTLNDLIRSVGRLQEQFESATWVSISGDGEAFTADGRQIDSDSLLLPQIAPSYCILFRKPVVSYTEGAAA